MEDWRAKVDLNEEKLGPVLMRWLREHHVEEELAERLQGKVVISQDDDKLFLYAESREQAEAAIEIVRTFLAQEQVEAAIELQRWHDIEEEWEDAAVPLPETPEEIEAERRRKVEIERQESEEAGADQWEVQVTLPDHKSTKQLAEKLEAENMELSRRWRYLVIPVPSEEDGRALAERIRGEAPADAQISVEGSYGSVAGSRPYSRFSWLGGFGN
jgi:hypothetical protein